MAKLHRNVSVLSLCVCLWMSGSSLMVATAALVGFALADDKSLATLPPAAQFIATLLTSIPAALLMQRLGRRTAFLISTVFGMLGAALACLAVLLHSFWLFVAGAFGVGMFNGFASYFRFTAADSVGPADKARAVSYVMMGGVAAALIGPNLAEWSREWVAGAEFAGSYAILAVLYLLIFAVLFLLRTDDKKQAGWSFSGGRPLREIAAQPHYRVALACGLLGYVVMAFVMTATPLAMDQHHFLFHQTSLVIQWHVLAMFAPSFFTGNLIRRFGVLAVMAAGAVLGILCVAVNLGGTSLAHFLAGLILLGMSWNFLYVGATALISETYTWEEKNKAQALNDFLIFSGVALATLGAGALQNAYGWRMVNLGVLPLLGLALLGLLRLHAISGMSGREPRVLREVQDAE